MLRATSLSVSVTCHPRQIKLIYITIIIIIIIIILIVQRRPERCVQLPNRVVLGVLHSIVQLSEERVHPGMKGDQFL